MIREATAEIGEIAGPDERPHAVESIRAGVVAYLQRLGLVDPELIEVLAEDCLQRARRKIAPDAPREDFFRRALEEVQRRYDFAVAQAFNLSSKEFHLAAALRAALLLNGEPSDFLFRPGDDQAERIARLQAALPMATPPEARLEMKEQPISFFFSSST